MTSLAKLVWKQPSTWEALATDSPPLTFRWRMEMGCGFFLHVSRRSGDGTYVATVKGPAGLLNVTKSGFRKRGPSMVKWAMREARRHAALLMKRTPIASAG